MLKKKYVLIGICAAICWFIVHVGVMLTVGLSPDVGTGDVIVVLGNKVELNGNPSQRLKDRLETALHLFISGKAKHIIVSGGFGKEGYDEAVVMRDYLVGRGVSLKSITKDSHGINTRATARFTAEYLKDLKGKRVIVVSQYYHILRCKLAFRQVGITEVLGAPADIRLERRDPFAVVREFVAYYVYLVRGFL